MRSITCFLLLGFFIPALHAADITAEYKQGKYFVNASFVIEANAKDVIRALTDYENIAQFNSAIIDVEVLESNQLGHTKVRTKVKDCVLFFCKEIIRVEQVKITGIRSLEAEVIPFLSDLREGYTKWVFQQNQGVTEVTYQSTIQPKFWIPPYVRSRTVTKKIKKRMLETVARLQMHVPEYEHR